MKTIRTLLAAFVILHSSFVIPLAAQVPQLLNYQGRVAVGTVNFNGTGSFKFALVNAAGTTTFWSNDGTSTAGSQPTAAVSLTVAKGLYSVLLGDTSLAGMTAIPNSVFANADVRLRVWFNDGTNGSQLLTPDQRLVAVGYALVAGTLQSGAAISASTLEVSGTMHVGSYSPGGATKLIEFGDPGFVSIGENTVDDRMELTAGSFVFNNGSVGLGVGLPTVKLDVAGTVKATAFTGNGAGLTNVPDRVVTAFSPRMALIPAGTFTMGNSIGDADIADAAPVSVNVSAFSMETKEVSLGDWYVVAYWGNSHGYGIPAIGGNVAPHAPARGVSWYHALLWCNARSEMEGRTPVYYTDDAQTTVYRTGTVNVTNAQVKWTANGYRLPTEAEWEKAARGGLSGQRFPWGNTIFQHMANYFGDSATYAYDTGTSGNNVAVKVVNVGSSNTSPVGTFAANSSGLHDMAGNEDEWCWDWYGTPYAGGTDPRGPASGSLRVIRGGSWELKANFCRAAHRSNFNPVVGTSQHGFRTVLSAN